MEPEEKIHVLTKDLCKDLTSTLSRARSGCEANPSEWVEKRISGELGPSIGRYARYFSELGISSHGELTELFKTHYKSRNGIYYSYFAIIVIYFPIPHSQPKFSFSHVKLYSDFNFQLMLETNTL